MATANRITALGLKILYVGLLVFVLDAALGLCLRKLYFGMNWGKSYRITYALERTSEQILFFGSSRAYTHYVPDVFERKFGMNSYNVGHDAAGVLYDAAILEGILTRYRPKMIVLDFRPDEMAQNIQGFQMLSVLLPYYRDHREIRRIIHLRGPAERLKHLSKIYPFNSQLLTILLANRIQWSDDRGFVPLYGQWAFPLAEPNPVPRQALDSIYVKTFLDFIALAKRNGIALSVVVSPAFQARPDRSASIRTAEEICRRQNILFLDYSRDQRFLQRPDLFHDPAHLNAEGARLFSEILADQMLRSASPAPASIPRIRPGNRLPRPAP